MSVVCTCDRNSETPLKPPGGVASLTRPLTPALGLILFKWLGFSDETIEAREEKRVREDKTPAFFISL